MKRPLQITFQEIEPPIDLRELIEEKMRKLDALSDEILGARVVVAAPHRQKLQGVRYETRIEMSLPGRDVVVGNEPGDRFDHENVFTSVRDAFRAAERQLKSRLALRRREVKTHEGPPTARVLRLFPYEGYGFLLTDDGREIFFNRNAVLEDGFERLEVGDVVRFTEAEESDEGPRASTVSL